MLTCAVWKRLAVAVVTTHVNSLRYPHQRANKGETGQVIMSKQDYFVLVPKMLKLPILMKMALTLLGESHSHDKAHQYSNPAVQKCNHLSLLLNCRVLVATYESVPV